jgi:hypothetical protein
MKMHHSSSPSWRRVTCLPLALLACFVLLSACVVQASAATAQVAWTPLALTDTAGSPTVAATVEQCAMTGEEVDRSATFSGEMAAIAGTARMEMRIEVQERLPGEELFHTVSAPGLGVWRGSASGVKIYQYVKQVTNLSFPADYRALVRFHWLNDKGYVIRRAERHTLECVQPASAPTSTPAPVTPATPTTPGGSTTPSSTPTGATTTSG